MAKAPNQEPQPLDQQEQETLKQGLLLKEMVATKGWQEIFQPYLKLKLQHSWLDPRQVQDREKFFYQYVTGWGFAQAAQEILDYLEKTLSQTEYLLKKSQGEIEPEIRLGE